MNEQQVTAMMSEALVSRGKLTAAQVAEGTAAEGAPVTVPAPVSQGSDIRARADELVSSGAMTRAQADAALAQYNTAPLPEDEISAPAIAAVKGPLSASTAADPFAGVELPEGFQGAERASDYRIEPSIASQLTIEQLKGISETFHVARIPLAVAPVLVAEIAQLAAQKMDPLAVKMQRANTGSQLHRLWGDKAGENLDTALQFIERVDGARPGAWKLLEDSNAIGSYSFLVRIFDHATRIKAAQAAQGISTATFNGTSKAATVFNS